MMKNIKSVLILVCICSVIGLLLAGTNQLTAPIIEKNQNAAANAALLEVLPEGTGFEPVDLSSYELPATVTEAYQETSGLGYVIQLTTAGYGSDLIIMCGIKADGIVSGAVCLSSNETLGYEKTYGANFTDKDAAAVDATDTIAGATKTTAAYKGAVKDALNAAIILGGGSVDIRSEEEILADNLSEALPAGEGAFTKMFLTEVLEGVDAVYSADNGQGYVCVIGEEFVGVDAEGNSDNTVAATAIGKLIDAGETADEAIDLEAYPDIHQNITEILETSSGNYVFTINGAGYGIVGGDEYHPASGEYIIIKVSMTPDGKIIDCLTVYQAETEGIGSACADESFSSQFDGKTQEDYTTIDAIGGATLTTNGYLKAIERCFDALTILEGGAK